MTGYKLFRISKKHPGKLYPLYVLSDKETKVGQWLEAECGERTADGRVKSRNGTLAFRPGWHLSDLPIATHIGVKENGVIRYQRPDTVWCECEYSDELNYQDEANRNGINASGVLIPKNAFLKHIPVNGFYRYKTSPHMTGTWAIAGAIFVKRILSDDEVDRILKENGIAPMPRSGGPLDLAGFGFHNLHSSSC